MSNIIKWNYVSFDGKEKHIVDSDHNDRVRETIFGETGHGMIAGIRLTTPQDIADAFLKNAVDNSCSDGQEEIGQDWMPELERERFAAEAESILSNARDEASAIVEYASQEAEEIRTKAYLEGKTQGYDEGLSKGREETEEKLKALSVQEEALSEEKIRLASDYQKQIEGLEPFFADLCASLVEKITGVLISEKRDIIMHLIQTGMEDAGRCQQFFIHVSKEDYAFVREHKGELLKPFETEVSLEIMEDAELVQNQCIIETEGKMIDSSLDVQLRNLSEDLRLLAL